MQGVIFDDNVLTSRKNVFKGVLLALYRGTWKQSTSKLDNFPFKANKMQRNKQSRACYSNHIKAISAINL